MIRKITNTGTRNKPRLIVKLCFILVNKISVSAAPEVFWKKPRIRNAIIVMMILGIVVWVMYRMWVNKSDPAIAGARLVVSLNGESLSPKYAPDITAPATIPTGISRARPIPIKAIPTVAEVVQLLPVAIEMMAQMTIQAGKKILGCKI